MSSRRNFLKSAFIVTAGLSLGVNEVSAGTGPFPSGIVYTKDDPGMWSKKVGSHAPLTSVNGMDVTVTTEHPMSADHYIVRHTLVSADGTVVGSQTFSPNSNPVSHYVVPRRGVYYATSFCNLHDFWVTKFTV